MNRELFKTKKGIVINADINGAYNILKKYMIKKCDLEWENISNLS